MKIKMVCNEYNEIVPEDTLTNRIYSALPGNINGRFKTIPEGFVPVYDKLVYMPGSIEDAILIQRGDTVEEAHGEVLAWDGERAASFDPKEADRLKLDCASRMKREKAAEAKRAADFAPTAAKMAAGMAQRIAGEAGPHVPLH